MKYTSALCCCFLLVGLACQKQQETQALAPRVPDVIHPWDTLPWQTYIIPQGAHYSNENTLRFFNEDSLVFRLSFDTTARYQTLLPTNQKDWNKVLGFSDCGGHHHGNSARLAWRYDPSSDLIELGRYLYRDSTRTFTTLDSLPIGDTLYATVYRNATNYGFTLGEKEWLTGRRCKSTNLSYWLFPYFGGDETAPQEIHLYVQHLTPTL